MSMVRRSVVSVRGYGHGYAMAGGEKLSAALGIRARGRERRGRAQEKQQGLTADPSEAEARPGKRRGQRRVAGNLGGPKLKKTAMAVLWCIRGLVARWRGRRGRGGASGRVGEARGRRWLRWWRAASAAALGCPQTERGEGAEVGKRELRGEQGEKDSGV